jgi:hypothetical protein
MLLMAVITGNHGRLATGKDSCQAIPRKPLNRFTLCPFSPFITLYPEFNISKSYGKRATGQKFPQTNMCVIR